MLPTGAFGLLLVYATAMPLLAGGLMLWVLPMLDAPLRTAGSLGLPLFAGLGAATLAEGAAAGGEGLVGRAALVLAVAATAGLAWYVVRAVRRALAP
jgi:hypothetical protein